MGETDGTARRIRPAPPPARPARRPPGELDRQMSFRSDISKTQAWELPDGDRRCRVVWITDLLPDTLAELVEGFMEQGVRRSKRTLETAEVTG